MTLEDYFKDGQAYVWDETFAIIQSEEAVPSAFVNIVDRNEITVIIEQSRLDIVKVIQIERDWKIFTLDIVFPMDVCGVTAKVGTELAKAGVSIMPMAAYSRDHFLIKEADAERARGVFEGMGIKVIQGNRPNL